MFNRQMARVWAALTLRRRLTREGGESVQAPAAKSIPPVLMASVDLPDLPISPVDTVEPIIIKQESKNTQREIIKKLKAILADISGLEEDEIKEDVEHGNGTRN